MVQNVTYSVCSILLSLCFLQIISFLCHTEPPPALADALVDLRLWNIGSLLLQNLVNIEIVEQIGRPKTDRFHILHQYQQAG